MFIQAELDRIKNLAKQLVDAVENLSASKLFTESIDMLGCRTGQIIV